MRRTLATAAVLLVALTGAVFLSGSDQPVTAHPYPHWQELSRPPLSPRTGALGVRVGHRVLVLGGVRRDGSRARDGASYDLRTGYWHRLVVPVRVTARDAAVAAGGRVVLGHVERGGAASWWTLDPGPDTWVRLRHVPAHLSAPSAFGSEVYALAGRHVVVHSVRLDGWTRLPTDPLRPSLQGRRVAASRAGTVVTGRIGGSRARVADRWDGVAWHRSRLPAGDRDAARSSRLPAAAPRRGSTSVPVGSRIIVVGSGRAWIFTP